MRYLLIILSVLCCLTWGHIGYGQVSQDVVSSDTAEVIVDPTIDIEGIKTQLEQIETTFLQKTIALRESQTHIKQLSSFQDVLSKEKQRVTAQLENTTKKIAALSALVAEGETEPEDIAKQRKELTDESDKIKSKIASADMALAKIDEINQLIINSRNQALFDQILVKHNSILHWRTFVESIKSFALFFYNVGTYPVQWYDNLTDGQQMSVKLQLEKVGVWFLLAFAGIALLSYFIRKKLGYRKDILNPDYSHKVMAGFFVLLARGIIPAAMFGLCWLWLKNHQDLFSGSFGTVLRIGIIYGLYLFICSAVVRVLFTPKRPNWRLIEVNDDKAKSLYFALNFSIIIICVFSYFQVLAIQLEHADNIIYALKSLSNIVKALCIILVVNRFLYNDRQLTDEELNDGDVQQLSTSSKISILMTLLTLIVLSFSLFGYVILTEYIYNKFIESVFIVGLFYIIHKLFTVLFHQFVTRKFWMRDFRVNRKQTEKWEFWFGFFLSPIVIISCVLVLLFVWGVSVDILLQKLKKFFIGFNIGGMHVSITSVFLGIVAFFVVLFISKWIKNSLLNGKLSNIEMDSSIRNSLAAGIGFVGIIIACLAGISVMGGSLKGLALVAGALSLGAGLGLQNVVNNFVSGIILLFERPIKIGDWVIINGEEGTVKQVNIRSTVIETFNRANVIIPNADILSNTVTNMTYKNKMGRVDVAVGVDYDSDVVRVQEILLDVVKNTKGILVNPAPFVLLMDLADNSLNFRVSCYTNDIGSRASLSSAIRAEILTRFRSENINIPFPQRVVHLCAEDKPIGVHIVTPHSANDAFSSSMKE